ncbi:hypothetical protein V6N11_029681 [Hibiscus sabdariffa]|uniref:Uncharacterized protein n=2 Tax=Hibiscus sabdariffa TaxID=183260 RepID=A0ABR2A510_9ROSI
MPTQRFTKAKLKTPEHMDKPYTVPTKAAEKRTDHPKSSSSPQLHIQLLRWQSPPSDSICLHTDGAVNADSSLSSIGGLFRDSAGS